MDSLGNIYGSDYSGDAIYRIDPSGNATVFADGMSSPNGLAFVSSGNLYACDNNGNAIYVLDAQGNYLDTISITNPSGIIKMPDSDSLWFTTYNPSALYKLAPDHTVVPVHAAGVLNGPVGLCYNESDELFVGNFSNRAIYKVFDDTMIFIAQVPSDGFGSALGFITYAQGGIWGTSFGSNKIYKINPSYTDSVVLFIGSAQGTQDGIAVQALFDQPNGIYASHTGDSILISDYGTGNIRILSGQHLNEEEITDPEIDFDIAPNPAQIDINLIFTKALSGVDIIVYDISGKMIHQEFNLNGERIRINTQLWEDGLYILQVDAHGQRMQKRVVVQH